MIKHSFTNIAPNPSELKVAELALQIFKDEARLYTKNINGDVIELGKGKLKFTDLLDVDTTNMEEGSFLVRQGDSFSFSKFIGSIGSLSDIELDNPESGQYLRYDGLYEAFRNFTPTYNLYELLDVDLPDLTNEIESQAVDDMTLYYSHDTGKFRLRLRNKLLSELEDVELNAKEPNQILQLDSDGLWKNLPLDITKDPTPVLGGDLDCNANALLNSTYKVNTLVCSSSIETINYFDGDYWILEGQSKETVPQCVVNINFSSSRENAVAIMMLEIRQDTGEIIIAGLPNIKYEDGKPIELTGAGSIDLITILWKKIGEEYITYVTAAAMNLAEVGSSSIISNRYDKFLYPYTQVFYNENRYDSYFEYVQLLLNFEEELSTSRLWYEDKSNNYIPVNTTTTQENSDLISYGIVDKLAAFITELNTVDINPVSPLVLDTDFTLELFIRHPNENEYLESSTTHKLFSNIEETLKIEYIGSVDDNQTTELIVTVHDSIYKYPNAYNYFKYRNNLYIHLALVRKDSLISLYVDGIIQNPIVDSGLIALDSDINISSADITGFIGLLNSVRLTSTARYISNFQIPSMRFGLTGGASDILHAQVFNIYKQLDRELEFNIFI